MFSKKIINERSRTVFLKILERRYPVLQSGQLKQKGSLKKGKRRDSRPYENGQLSKKILHKDGKEEGPWMWYYPNGQLMEEGTFTAGQKQGLCLDTPNGQLSKRFRSRITKQGPFETYTNGMLHQRGIYEDDPACMRGSTRTDNLGRKAPMRTTNRREFETYYSNGQLREKGAYDTGKKQGLCQALQERTVEREVFVQGQQKTRSVRDVP